MASARWKPGDHVLVEMMVFDVPFMTVPVTVLADSADLIALYFADGTTYRQLVTGDGSGIPRVIPREEFNRLGTRYIQREYPGRSVLVLAKPGAAHAIHVSWEMPGWRFQQWYVNLQTPLDRTPTGFRSTDQFLDIVVAPDLSWRWKDEDELAEAVTVGRLTQQEAEAVRAEGERVVTDIEARRWPFDGSLVDWRPDPSWGVLATLETWRFEHS